MHVLLLAGSCVIAALQIAGSYVISRKLTAGWVISMICCVLAVPYDVITGQYGFVVTSVISFVVAARAFGQWRVDERVAQRIERLPPKQ